MLRFISSEPGYLDLPGYSTYERPDGSEVFLQDGTRKRLTEWAEIDVLDTYQDWSRKMQMFWHKHDFERHVMLMVIDPEMVEIYWCHDCHDPEADEDLMHSVPGGQVCESCLDNYFFCEGCETHKHDDDAVHTLYDTVVCERCINWGYSYCEYCDGYRADDDYEHDSCGDDEDCDCEAPHQRFRVRNNGHGFLANDERTTMALPAGHISDEGIGAMSRLIRTHSSAIDAYDYDADGAPNLNQEMREMRTKWWNLSYQVAEVGQEWQNKQGNFTKRLSRYAYKQFGIKLPADLVTQIGNIGSQHSQGSEVQLEVTRNLNLPREEFAHDGSCWWTEYHTSRCTLKSNGGFGLRSFKSVQSPYSHHAGQTYDQVVGRAWIQPLMLDDDGNLEPTHESENADAYVVFNGYGDLSGYTPARVWSHMMGMTYRKVGFSGGEMYVNNESGYLVAPEELAAKYTDGSLGLDMDIHAHLPAPTSSMIPA